MKHLLLFNPDNDLALASGLDYYTAPAMAVKLGHDLQMLPAWWAGDGDLLLTQPSQTDRDWADHLRSTFGINIELTDKNHLQNHHLCYQPWGWNASLRHRLANCSVPLNQLPTTEQIEHWRNLSHRRTTIRIHRRISQLLGRQLCHEPEELTTISQVEKFAANHPGCFLKAPWSSSGKGIFRPLSTDNLTFTNWANGILQRQGAVIAEHALNKTLDFAMEFRCHEGIAEFIGYSIFRNDQYNSFDYGLVAQEKVLQQIITDEIGIGGEQLLSDVRQALTTVISQLVAPDYDGFLGVDMLVFADETGRKSINPCIEMNLRCTMGVVTSIIGNRFFHPGSIGRYHVQYLKSPASVAQYMHDKITANPPVTEIVDGMAKIKAGTIAMAPVYHDSRYCAYIEAEPIRQ